MEKKAKLSLNYHQIPSLSVPLHSTMPENWLCHWSSPTSSDGSRERDKGGSRDNYPYLFIKKICSGYSLFTNEYPQYVAEAFLMNTHNIYFKNICCGIQYSLMNTHCIWCQGISTTYVFIDNWRKLSFIIKYLLYLFPCVHTDWVNTGGFFV